MNIAIAPNLDGLASERLRAFAKRLAAFASGDPAIRAAAETEATWARRTPLLNGQQRRYDLPASSAARKAGADVRPWRHQRCP